MHDPDFHAYTLALFDGGEMIFSSRENGLAPLLACTEEFRGRRAGCTLHDKVFGLAAARLVVWGGFISVVVTGVASRPAGECLARYGIPLRAGVLVENILRRDRSAVCPGERIAGETPGDEELVRRLKALQAP